jgi:RNA polymerase sigma-70 factor (ECF subfamily)
MPPGGDDALIERAVLGDEQALDRLFRRYYATMLRFAQKICRDPSDAEDVTHDAFVTLMGSIGSFDRRAAFSTWLYRVVLNKAIDFRRKVARRGRLADQLRLVSTGSYDAPQEAAVAARQVIEFLLDFPDKERDAALLVLGEGLTHKQAAEIIGCPVGTIGWLLGSAGKRLNEILEAGSNDRENPQDSVREAGASAPVARC